MHQPILDVELLVTRPIEQATLWAARLAQCGVNAKPLPLLAIEALTDPSAVHAAWRSLSSYQLLMFVSPSAVEKFFALAPRPCPAGSVRAWPQDLQVASPGPGTTAQLVECGVPQNMIVEPATDSQHYDSEALWQKLQVRDWNGRSVMVICGDGGRDWLAQQLRGRGARVESVVAYRRTAPVWTAELKARVEEALARPTDHLWLFSSSEAIGHLIARYPAPRWSSSVALVTHPRIAQAASQAGFLSVYTSKPTLPAIVACIQSAATAEKL